MLPEVCLTCNSNEKDFQVPTFSGDSVFLIFLLNISFPIRSFTKTLSNGGGSQVCFQMVQQFQRRRIFNIFFYIGLNVKPCPWFLNETISCIKCGGPPQGSRWRAIRAKKSPCEGWLRFPVGQKRSSSRLVILKSRPMSPSAYFLHLSFMKMLISCLLNSIVSVKNFESDILRK